MADSDSFFDDDIFAGEPSEELLRDSVGSFDDLDDVAGLESDTPAAEILQEEVIAKAQEEDAKLVAESSEAVTETTDDDVAAVPAKKKSRFGGFNASELTIFDAALLISLIFISLATLMLFFELRTFGNFPFDGFPWRTDKF